jgi:integrase
MSSEDQFSIHTRPSKRGPVFYVQFRNEDGTWTNAKSTRIVDHGRKRDYQAAVSWAKDYLNSGQVVTKERVKFKDFADGFFDWNGEWAKEKRIRRRRISKRQCRNHEQSVQNHLLPFFGDLKLTAIRDSHIRKWQHKCFDAGMAGATINRKTVALRIILKEAYRRGLIQRMPVVESVAEDNESRGVYTPAEIQQLFSLTWPDKRAYAANLTAAVTGMRASEIVGLQEKHIFDGYVVIEQSFSPQWGIGPPKTGKARSVPIPSRVQEALTDLLSQNPFRGEDRFVFYSTTPDRPMEQRVASEILYKMLEKINVARADRERRRLDFHSWRHTANTWFASGELSKHSVQAVTGHLTEAMSQRYFHLPASEMRKIRTIQEQVFSPADSNTDESG